MSPAGPAHSFPSQRILDIPRKFVLGQGGGCGVCIRIHRYTMSKQSGNECTTLDAGKDGWALEKVAGNIMRATCPRHPTQWKSSARESELHWYDMASALQPALAGGAVHALRHARGRAVALQRHHGGRLQAGPHTPAILISKLKVAAAMRLARRAPVAYTERGRGGCEALAPGR